MMDLREFLKVLEEEHELQKIKVEVGRVNALASELAKVNLAIAKANKTTHPPNALYDRRDSIIQIS